MLSEFLKSFTNRRQNGELSGIHSVERFRSILEHERARCIRSGQVLSLVVFNANHSDTETDGNQHLAHVITGRIRSTDKAGWLDNQHIAAVLPYTSTTGARRLAKDVCQSITARTSSLQFTIYTHPFNWLFDNNGQSAQLNIQNISPAEKTKTSPRFFVSTKYIERRRNIDSATQHSRPGERTQSYVALEKGLGPFLLRPLPAWKRTMDVVVSSLGLIMLSPLMLLVTVIIKIVSPGPALFKQQRVGYMGKPFTMWKFRTMKVNADATAHQQYLAELINSAAHNDKNSGKPMVKLDNDPQITPFGKILRRTYLDELPQLINVLRGEMTLVGPRPPIPYEVKEYLPWHKRRMDVVPGMTGLWQVSGKDRLTFNEMVCLDIRYWEKKSLWLDTKILLMTPIAIFSHIKDGFRNGELQKGEDTKNA